MTRSLLAAIALSLAACAVSPVAPEVRQALAPTGKLRVAVYPGSPTSMVKDASGETRGVTWDLGQALAARLGVPFEPVVFARPAEVIEGLKAGKADVTFTNATPARAKVVDFTQPLLGVEQGFLVPAGSKVSGIEQLDRPGVRVGVTAGSTSQDSALTRGPKQFTLVPTPDLKEAVRMLSSGELDAYSTNKAILWQLSDQLPGSRILEGRIGLETMALGIPHGREAGMAWLRRFAGEAAADGSLDRAVARAGVRGTVKLDAHQGETR
jgi:polar amino acid transport system substrate-binding protein